MFFVFTSHCSLGLEVSVWSSSRTCIPSHVHISYAHRLFVCLRVTETQSGPYRFVLIADQTSLQAIVCWTNTPISHAQHFRHHTVWLYFIPPLSQPLYPHSPSANVHVVFIAGYTWHLAVKRSNVIPPVMSQVDEISHFDIEQLRHIVEMFNQHNGKSIE